MIDWQSKRFYSKHDTQNSLHQRTTQLMSTESTYLSFLCTVQYYWRPNDTAICFAEVAEDRILEVWYNEDSLKFWGITISKLFYRVCLYARHFNFLDVWGSRGKHYSGDILTLVSKFNWFLFWTITKMYNSDFTRDRLLRFMKAEWDALFSSIRIAKNYIYKTDLKQFQLLKNEKSSYFSSLCISSCW